MKEDYIFDMPKQEERCILKLWGKEVSKKENLKNKRKRQKQTCFSSIRSKLSTANDKFVYKWNRKQPERNVGGLRNFGESNLYDQNKQNVKELLLWAMTYEDEKSTRDVMVQTDLGEERRLNCVFLKCMWIILIKILAQEQEEGYFELILRQTVFNEENIKLK